VLAEKIVQLLSDDELKEKFRKNGYTKIQHFFTWDIIAMEFSNVYAMVFTDHKNNG
jgi:glycosyltransferase involved in cell wall biosynthesis